jgi:hypothetical protein
LVVGDRLFKIVEINEQETDRPRMLTALNGAVGSLKEKRFVGCTASPDARSGYALTDDGHLVHLNLEKSFVVTPILLGEPTTSLTMDAKILLVGTRGGDTLAVRQLGGNDHRIFGKFSARVPVVAVGIADRQTVAAYQDGSLIFWQRKVNSGPFRLKWPLWQFGP